MRLKFFILFIVFLNAGLALKAQTQTPVVDSSLAAQQIMDSAKQNVLIKDLRVNELLKDNFLLNFKAKPVEQLEQVKKSPKHFFFFYILLGLGLFLGIARAVNTKYFNTLFRVFFNTSLRQSQLTDQLEQANLMFLF